MASFFEKLKKGMGIEESGEIEEISSIEDSESKKKKKNEVLVSPSVSLQDKLTGQEKSARKRRGYVDYEVLFGLK